MFYFYNRHSGCQKASHGWGWSWACRRESRNRRVKDCRTWRGIESCRKQLEISRGLRREGTYLLLLNLTNVKQIYKWYSENISTWDGRLSNINFFQYDKLYHKTMAGLNNTRIAELFKFKKKYIAINKYWITIKNLVHRPTNVRNRTKNKLRPLPPS